MESNTQKEAIKSEIWLFETIKRVNGKTPLLAFHIKRLERSFRSQNIAFSVHIDEIKDYISNLPIQKLQKVKITSNGKEWKGEYEQIWEMESPIRAQLLYFERDTPELKYTTQNYARIMKTQPPDVWETLLINRKNHVTEGNRSNLWIKKGKTWITPKDYCLHGVMREKLINDLRKKGEKVTERVIKVAELASADEIHISNALRGMLQVEKVVNLDEFVN